MITLTTIKPTGDIIQQNSTHAAVKTDTKIEIWTIGFEDKADDGFKILPEMLYSIPLENEDDLFDIFEKYDEDNRINLAEANGTIWD